MKKFIYTILTLPILLLFTQSTYAADADFEVDTNSTLTYVTGEDYVSFEIAYVRKINNSSYYFPATGEKLFFIPEFSGADEDIQEERKFKTESLSVKDRNGKNLNYSIEEEELGQGMYVVVPSYKTTTSSSPDHIVVRYNARDHLTKAGSYIKIQGTSLPSDVIFSRKSEANSTTTEYSYSFSIVTDSKLPALVGTFPKFSKTEKDDLTTYNFGQTERIGNTPTLEFGTEALYRFEFEYPTTKTDSIIPENISDKLGFLSSNIYEVTLPREFAENDQKVYFDEVSPLPISIYRDYEGNVVGVFEVPANKDSSIKITGYISLGLDEWTENRESFDMTLEEYFDQVSTDKNLSKYLFGTMYWQINDELIKQEAESLKKDQLTILELIKTDYAYVNEKLEYDNTKAISTNNRLGAKEALEGGSGVCMEYADLMVALLRAQGVPARGAVGASVSGNDLVSQDQLHQWVQVWIPDYGWLSVDPTVESTNMRIGQMANLVLFQTINSADYVPITIATAGNSNSALLELSEKLNMGISPTTEDVDVSGLMEYTDLISEEEIEESAYPPIWVLVNTGLKATPIGRAVLISMPILIVLALLILLIVVLRVILKRIKKK